MTVNHILTTLASILTAGSAASLVALLNIKATKRKLLADSAHSQANAEQATAQALSAIADTAVDLLDPLHKRIAELRQEITDLRAQLNRAHRKVQSLAADLEKAHQREREARQQADTYAARVTGLEEELARLRTV